MTARILIGDCRVRMAELADASVDSVVCDPPYHLTSIVKRFGSENAAPAKVGKTGAYARASKGFMGQTWDGGDVAFDPETWAEVLRVLKPGGHLVAFSGTRTYHRMAVAIEDAGFEIRDQLAWVYGSGFPKSLDVSKQIDKSRAATVFDEMRQYLREAIATAGVTQMTIKRHLGYPPDSGVVSHWVANSQPGVPRWADWVRLKDILPLDGRFDALIETVEREVVGMKTSGIANPSEGKRATIGAGASVVVDITAPATDAAREWQGWGTALKPSWEPICLARKPLIGTVAQTVLRHGTGALNIDGCRIEHGEECRMMAPSQANIDNPSEKHRQAGRRKEVLELKPEGRWPANLCHDGSDEVLAGFPDSDGQQGDLRGHASSRPTKRCFGDMGPAADHPARNDSGSAARFFYCAKTTTEERGEGNNHPTVKPIALMRWLCRLVTPKGGTILDPFMGSGSTLLAAEAEQFSAIGCEMSPDYASIAERRLRDAGGMFAEVSVCLGEAA